MMLSTCVQASNWEINLNPGSPQQKNGFDCGVFTMMAMKRVCSGESYDSFTYDQQRVTDIFRPLCALECYAQKLATEVEQAQCKT